MRKRNICVIITDKAQLSRLLTLIKELKKSSRFKLQLIVSGAALTFKYGNVLKEVKKQGLKPDMVIPTVIEGADALGMAKTAALGMLEFATAFDNLKPDLVVIRGDRFEMLPIATAAAYLGKVIVHLEGGDVTGSIDESVRHAITKLAHIHFVTNREAKERLIKMGERRDRVWNLGSLDIDFLTRMKMVRRLDNGIVNEHGIGAQIDLSDEYLMVMYNPVTTEVQDARRQIGELLTAMRSMDRQVVWIWPNLGAGSDTMAKKMREWQVRHVANHKIRFLRYVPAEDYINLINQAAVMVGNSSAGIKECGWLGVPAVNIGSRQQGRLKGQNVMDVPCEKDKIVAAIEKQVSKGRYKKSKLYGDGGTAKKMVAILRDVAVDVQKRITY